jgi:signal transduction histidine kinase
VKGSYPRNIAIVSVAFIVCILFLAVVNLYVGIQFRNEFITHDRNTIISVATLCGLFMHSSHSDSVLFFQLKNINQAFDFEWMIVCDSAGVRIFDSHVLKPQFLLMYRPVDFSSEFDHLPEVDELLRYGTTYLYRSDDPSFYLYVNHPGSYLSTYDTLFRWHLVYITFSLIFVGFLGVFLIRNLFLPMRYVTKLARDLGVEMQKEDFVSETFSEIFKKMKAREETLVEFSAYIAHEFRNSIGAIAGLARLVGKGQNKSNEIVKECQTMEKLIERLLEYSKPMDIVRTDFDIAALVADAIERSRPPKHVKVQKNINLEKRQLHGDHELLTIALANLLKNGYEAIKGKGQVTIEAAAETG